MRNSVISESPALLSLYIDGRYCECNVHSLPYLKDTVIMLPLDSVAAELGLKIEHQHELGYDILYHHSLFDEDALTIRYVKDENDALKLSYCYQNGQLLSVPPLEMEGDKIFIPMELVSLAFNCTCQVSDSGNINIRSKE